MIFQSKPMQKEMGLIKADVITSLKMIFPVFITAFFISFYFSNHIISWILSTINMGNVIMVTIRPFEMIGMMLSVSFSLALLIASPIVLWGVIKVVKPALLSHERKIVRNAGIAGLGMFVAGVAFAYFLFVPVVLQMMGAWTVGSIVNMWSIQYLFSFIIGSVTIFGIMFQIPIVLVILQTAGIVTRESLKKARPHVFIGLMVFSIILTPEDVLTMSLMVVPLYCLYEVGILIGRIIERRKI